MMRPLDSIEQVRRGVVGEFVPVVDPPLSRWLSGSLKLNSDDVVASVIADRDAFDSRGLPIECAALAGRTEAGDVLLLGINSRGNNRGHLDVARYRSEYLLVDVNLAEVNNDTVTGVQLTYHGLHGWVTDRIYKEDQITEGGKFVGWQAELRYRRGAAVPLDDGFTLRFSTAWEVGGEFDRRTFATPLAITVESEQRQPIAEHVVRIDAVHALLNIAHRKQVKASGGSAKVGPNSDWSQFWETNMMAAGANVNVTQEFPYLGLGDVAGIEGVAEWVRLVLNNRRAVVPLVRHTLFKNQTPEARLLSTAAAIEYWVAANRRQHDWAKKVDGEILPSALTRRVHESWAAWVGDPDQWLDLFWTSYQNIKHNPAADLDPSLIHALEVSGRWLLTSALLDECAGNKSPSRHLFETSLWNVGHDVREHLESAS